MNIYHSKLCLILTLLNLHIYSYLFRRFDWSTSVHDYTSIYNRKNSLLHYNAHASVIKYTPRYSLREIHGACFSGGESSSQTSSADLDARWALELRHFCRIWTQSGLKRKNTKYFRVRKKWQSWISRTDQNPVHSLHYNSPTDGASVRLNTAWLNLKYTSNGLKTKKL